MIFSHRSYSFSCYPSNSIEKKRCDNPVVRAKLRERGIKQFSYPEARKYEKNRKLFKVFRKDTMEFIKEFEYQFEAIEHIQKAFDVNVSSKISDVLNKNRKSTQGFVFEYVE